MSRKLAVFFPGIGYHVDKPLLYFSRQLVSELGYETVCVNYGGFESGIKGNAAKMQSAFEHAFEQTIEILKNVNLHCDDLVFIMKSVGTAVGGAYAKKMHLHPRFVCLTPVETTFEVMQEPCIVFHGSHDPWLDEETFWKKIREKKLNHYVIQDANHSLETGDAAKDLKNLSFVMEKIAEFLAGGHVGQ